MLHNPSADKTADKTADKVYCGVSGLLLIQFYGTGVLILVFGDHAIIKVTQPHHFITTEQINKKKSAVYKMLSLSKIKQKVKNVLDE